MTRIFSKESMESHLNTEQRAASRAFESLAEESLFLTVEYIRCLETVDGLATYIPEDAFGIWTPFWKMLMKRTIPKGIAELIKTKIGKHSRDEIVNIGNDDLRAISLYLGSKHYFTGFKPTRVRLCFSYPCPPPLHQKINHSRKGSVFKIEYFRIQKDNRPNLIPIRSKN
ncbi:unnamed protein product [Gongylonema pulchrum]|uniref:UPF0246 protein n=1 Tax=Gongylonema pulchrum TaxID=637853 RepID=A0A183F0Q3_9BILA|nr:unnamed protein product [Gongylonema pulchrum]